MTFTDTDKEKSTSKIYELGKRYPIEITASDTSDKEVKVEWLEDHVYQEIHKEQLYPKEYVKMESAVVNTTGTNAQEIEQSTGEYINKKVITNGQVLKKFVLNNTNTTATITKMDNTTENITIDGSITDGHGKLEGWLVYKNNKVMEPITENVSSIDYDTKTVTFKDGSTWGLYTDVEIVGRLMKYSSKTEYEKVYDLGRYITDANNRKLSDEGIFESSQLYRADEVDNTYVMNVYTPLNETQEASTKFNTACKEALSRYSTMERFVEDSKDVSRWNLGIGEARLYSIVPIRIMLSFDGDSSFDMKNPVIYIDKNLYKNKLCTTGDNVFKLSMPTDARDSGTSTKITSLYYGDWRYFGNEIGSTSTYQENTRVTNSSGNVDSSKGGTVTIEEDANGFKITLNGYTANNAVLDAKTNNNIMVNVLLRVDSITNNTSKEIFDTNAVKDRLLNYSYRTYTKAKVLSLNSGSIETSIMEIPIEMKIKEQVSFE